MADPELTGGEVRELPKRIPERIRIDISAGLPPHSPRETALMEDASGLDFQTLVGTVHSLRERVMVFLALRRQGYDPSWEDTLDVLVDIVAPGPSYRTRLDNLARFCHFWRMTPEDVYRMDAATFDAFVRFQNQAVAQVERERRNAQKGRR